MNTIERRGIARQANDWVARLNADDITATDFTTFAQWLNEHPLHKQEYDKACTVWNARLPAAAYAINIHPSRRRGHFLSGWSNFSGWSNLSGWSNALSAMTTPRVALPLLAVLAIGVLFLSLAPLRGGEEGLYRTARAEQLKTTLPDNSVLHLNSLSEVHVSFTDDVRLIKLQRGEAFFNVTHDPERPFVVDIGTGTVRAVGTQFTVRKSHEATTVAVIEGTVQVKKEIEGTAGKTLIRDTLTQDDYASYTMTGGEKIQQADIERLTAWRHGRVIFKEETLAAAVEEINRYRTLPIHIMDPELKLIKVNGAFNIDETDDFLTALEKFNVVQVADVHNRAIFLYMH